MTGKTIASCAECSYPIAAEHVGERSTCPMCGTINQAIGQGITIPTTLFWSVLAFGLGVLVGPALIATTTEGRSWLEKQARGIGR